MALSDIISITALGVSGIAIVISIFNSLYVRRQFRATNYPHLQWDVIWSNGGAPGRHSRLHLSIRNLHSSVAAADLRYLLEIKLPKDRKWLYFDEGNASKIDPQGRSAYLNDKD